MMTMQTNDGLEVLASGGEAQNEILTPEALDFFVELQREFNPRRLELLEERKIRQQAIDRGELPRFLLERRHVRESDWQVDPVPADLQDRRVEITGPVDRKMVINALNSGAKLFMADFEDANTPSWNNQVEGQINVRDAVRRTITFDDAASGKHYALNKDVAVLKV